MSNRVTGSVAPLREPGAIRVHCGAVCFEGFEPRHLLSGAGPTPPDPSAIPGLYHVVASLSQSRDVRTIVQAGDDLLLVGGDYTSPKGTWHDSHVVDIYNIRTGQWSADHLTAGGLWVMTYTVGDKVLFIGRSSDAAPATHHRQRYRGGVPIDVYDTATGQWSSGPADVPRDAAVGVVGDTAVFAGGYAGATGDAPSATTYVYDATANRWTRGPDLSAARYTTAVAVNGHRILFAGGAVAATIIPGGGTRYTPSDAVDIYDVDTGAWSAAHLSQARYRIGAVTVGSRTIFAGGYVNATTNDLGGDSATVDVYDAATNSWSTAALSAPMAPQTFVVGHRAIFYLGSQLDLYDADANGGAGAWSALGRPNVTGEAYYNQIYVFASIGTKVFFVGGAYGPNGTVTTVDLATGARVSHKLQASHSFTAVINGKVVMAGGFMQDGGPQDSNLVETYDPATDTWTTTMLPSHSDFLGGATFGDYAVLGIQAYDTMTTDTATLQLESSRWVSLTVFDDQLIYAGATYQSSADVDVFLPSPVGEPASPTPAAGAPLTTPPTAFTWAAGAGATSYDVYLDDALVAHVTDPQWSPAAALSPGSHAWQVVARDDAGHLTPGPRWTFTVGAPAAPTGPSVAPGARLPAPPTAFAWHGSNGADSYDVYVDGKLVDNTVDTSLALDGTLTGGRHTWQVIARNAVGRTPGPVWSFTTPTDDLAQTSRRLGRAGAYYAGGTTAITAGTKALFVESGEDPHDPPATVRVFDAVTGRWSTTALPDNRRDFYAAATSHTALFAGGDDSTDYLIHDSRAVAILDLDDGHWSTAKLSVAREEIAAVADADVAAFAGGESLASIGHWIDAANVDLFDQRNGRWSTAHLSQPRVVAATAVVGNKLLFAGGLVTVDGSAATAQASDVVDVYDTDGGRWSVTHLPHAASSLRSAVIGSRAYFAGDASVDVYDAHAGTWSTLAPRVPVTISSTIAAGQSLYVVGRPTSDDGASIVQRYDAKRGRWSVVSVPGDTPGAALAVAGTKVLFAGPRTDLSTGEPRVDVYDSATGTWSVHPVTLTDIPYDGAASIANTALFVGTSGDGAIRADQFTDPESPAPVAPPAGGPVLFRRGSAKAPWSQAS